MKEKSEKFWKEKLTPEQYRILRNKGTEMSFTGKYNDHKEGGTYRCAGCGTELFSSDTKFDSGTGWPSFDSPVAKDAVELVDDSSSGMIRTEVVCKKCGGHLGHVFDDPLTSSSRSVQAVRQDGKIAKRRFCINSCSLDFREK